MKVFDEIEDALLDTSESFKKAGVALLRNMGKIIALFVSLLMLAVTFTDITFSGFLSEKFTSSLALLITSSYIIYFSLEDAGEKCGEESEEYKRANERYNALRESVMNSDTSALRSFCIDYSKRELEYRRKNALLSRGLCEEDIIRLKNGKSFDKSTTRFLLKIDKLKPVIITPKTLICRERAGLHSELENPEKRKLITLVLKLIPSTVCMAVTLSVMLTAKEGLTGADVLNGILKLSALPMIGFKGYSAGYTYVKHKLSLFTETKSNILDEFLKKESTEKGNSSAAAC